MNRMLYKNTGIKIKKSLGRYLSLAIIVLVGVGFYAGIQASAPDFLRLAGRYYQDYGLLDFKVVSTLGLTDEDVTALKKLEQVDMVTGTYSVDAIGGDKAIRIHAIEETVNRVRLLEGRMPESGGECLADSRQYRVGDTIVLKSDVSDVLNTREFTVTGLVDSVLYVATDYGSTTVGDGKLASFIWIPREDFILEAYTELYITMKGTGNTAAYSGQYEVLANTLKDALTALKPEREEARYRSIYNDAYQAIAGNEDKLHTEKTDSEKALADAKATLDESAKKLKDGKAALDKNEAELKNSMSRQEAAFRAAKEKIAEGWTDIQAALDQNGIQKEELGGKAADLEQALGVLRSRLDALPADSPEYTALARQIAAYTAQKEGLARLQESIDTLTKSEMELNEGIARFQRETTNAKAKLKKGRQEVEENQKKLDDGYAEYTRNAQTFTAEIQDAEAKIADAKKELSMLEHPKWILSGREAAVGYEGLKTDTDVVASVAKVFPFFFIAIALLMTSNTMARMIAEERSELGTLASLGYTDGQIIRTYLLYVLSATMIGAITGFFLGCRFFPPLIFANFDYILPPLVVGYDGTALALILSVTAALMAGVTIAACMKELRENPAFLMRPLPPGRGRNILLERVGPVWNALSFTWKITLRNMFRYKKRALMTVAGVAGCCSLLLVGFGLRGSMDGIADRQYGDIFRYDLMAVLKEETASINGELRDLFERERLESPLLLRQSATQCGRDGEEVDAFLLVPGNEEGFSAYFHLTDKASGESVLPGEDGILISEKIAETLRIGRGDTLTLKDADNNPVTLKVAHVVDNYLSNYVYMSRQLYADTFAKAAMYNTAVCTFSGDEKTLAGQLMDSGVVVKASFVSDIRQAVLDGNSRLNSIIALLIGVASILAVIVLYNLTSINISERKREIATLKVLGFRDGETNAYIYREALILTLVSIMAGLLLGVVLYQFVLTVIEGSSRVLLRHIGWFSFFISGFMTMVFSIVMQAVTYWKLKGVDMVESLKSVE